MFTGIIKATGRIERVRRQESGLRLSIHCAELPWEDYETGESISVNGVCLTAVALARAGFEADVSSATLEATALNGVKRADRVNLEPSLTLSGRLGGHLVSGHVDCVGHVIERRKVGESLVLRLSMPQDYLRYVVRKGSICIDGVSLTVNEVEANTFSVNIIPHTAGATIAGDYQVGTVVNIEVDLIARYLEGLLERSAGKAAPADDITHTRETVSRRFLEAYGYA